MYALLFINAWFKLKKKKNNPLLLGNEISSLLYFWGKKIIIKILGHILIISLE